MADTDPVSPLSQLPQRLAGIERSQQEILQLLQQTQQELLRTADASTSQGRPVSPVASVAQETSAQVFLSYAPEDKGRVEDLYGRLRQAGFRPWMASQNLLPGEDKDFATRQAIRQSHFILACLSNNGIQQRGPVQRQLKMALDLWQEQLEDDIYLIPVRLDDCALPDKLHDFEPVDLFEPEGWPRLLRALEAGSNRRMPADSQVSSQPAPNPFGDVGRLTDPARFWNREELLRRIFEELDKGVNLSLVGEAQVGKSSVLSMICYYGRQRMHKAVTDVIYLSLEEVDDEDDFYAALCHKLGIDTLRGFKLRRALEGRRYVLCIDEGEKLYWDQFGFTRKMRSHLRGLADGVDELFTLVVASRSPLALLTSDSPELDSPLAGICHQVDVDPFSYREACAFLGQRLHATGIVFTPAHIDDLFAQSGGHPGRLQRAAADLFRQLSQSG